MNISDNIKAIASKYGKTITQIAAEMNVAQSQLSRTINNERINLKDLQTIASVIGCQVVDFFSEKPYPPTLPTEEDIRAHIAAEEPFINERRKVKCPHCHKDLIITIEEAEL